MGIETESQMPRPGSSPGFHRFALFTAAATLALVGVGGLVTSHGAGMAVPDWPNSYGYNMFLFPLSQWVGGIFYEHTHRLVASLVGLLTAVLAAWAWWRGTQGAARWLGVGGTLAVLVLLGVRQMPVYIGLSCAAPLVAGYCFFRAKDSPDPLRWLGLSALALVVLQGVLGGLRVVWLKDQIGILHGTLAQLFFVLMCAVALGSSRWWAERRVRPKPEVPGEQLKSLRALLVGTTLLILVQLMLGAIMRHQHAGLAIPDFPTAYGKLWPETDPASIARYNQQRVEVLAANPITAFQVNLQMFHRLTAVLVLAAVAICAFRLRKTWSPGSGMARAGLCWVGLLLGQAFLGAATIWSNKAADVATAHVLVGALSLATGALLSMVTIRELKLDRAGSPATRPLEVWGGRPFGASPSTAT